MVDLNLVRINAQKEGIPLSEITILYKLLTPLELENLKAAGGYVSESDNGTISGRFLSDGTFLFPEKAEAVLHLGA